MSYWLLVGTGGFLGGVLRYWLAQWIQDRTWASFPFGILSVNIIGCFAIGLFFGIASRQQLQAPFRLFFMTGLCGGFTTFSAFSLDTFQLLSREAYLPAFLYVAGSLVLCLLAVWAGILVTKAF